MARDETTCPAPVLEYAEQTGPNTMTFLSYPKYYRNTFGHLAEVDTTLVESSDSGWDYEVTKGTWTLRVITTYRFTLSQSNPSYITIGGYQLPYRTGTAEFDQVFLDGFDASYANGLTTFVVPQVNENPIFIRIQKN